VCVLQIFMLIKNMLSLLKLHEYIIMAYCLTINNNEKTFCLCHNYVDGESSPGAAANLSVDV